MKPSGFIALHFPQPYFLEAMIFTLLELFLLGSSVFLNNTLELLFIHSSIFFSINLLPILLVGDLLFFHLYYLLLSAYLYSNCSIFSTYLSNSFALSQLLFYKYCFFLAKQCIMIVFYLLSLFFFWN